MGTESIYNIFRLMMIEYLHVKLNNPLMGTETLIR